jgi:hypothetical protein
MKPTPFLEFYPSATILNFSDKLSNLADIQLNARRRLHATI